MGAEASPDISGLIGQYAHGNEPSHHVLYMYNYAGEPWKGQKLIRQVFDEMYKNAEDGLSGNEDVGQMSAWYVTSTLGLYQVEPAGGKYVFGSPLFDEATVQLPEGKTFTVKALDNSPENVYVQSVRWNGKPYTKSYLLYKDIMGGGTLEFTMGPNPSKFGTAKNELWSADRYRKDDGSINFTRQKKEQVMDQTSGNSGERKEYFEAELQYARNFKGHMLNGTLKYSQDSKVRTQEIGKEIVNSLPFRHQGLAGLSGNSTLRA